MLLERLLGMDLNEVLKFLLKDMLFEVQLRGRFWIFGLDVVFNIFLKIIFYLLKLVIKFIDLIINIFFLESLYDMCIFFEMVFQL